MMKHTIITIGRQFGSGGHEVGNRLAERLDIPLYDPLISVHMAAQSFGSAVKMHGGRQRRFSEDFSRHI